MSVELEEELAVADELGQPIFEEEAVELYVLLRPLGNLWNNEKFYYGEFNGEIFLSEGLEFNLMLGFPVDDVDELHLLMKLS